MSSTYQAFKVYLYNDADDSLTPLAGLTVKGYDFTTLTDLGTIGTTGSDGSIAGGTVATAGHEIRFRVEDDGHGRAGYAFQVSGSGISMDLVIRPTRGINLVFRPEALPVALPTPTVDASAVDIGWRLDGQPTSDTKLIGRFPPVGNISFPNFYATDQKLWIYVNPVNAHGIPAYAFIGDAPATPFVQNRETNTPVIAQSGNSGNTSITLKVSGFSQYARFRWQRSADDSGFTVNIKDEFISLAFFSDPTYQFATRPADTGPSTRFLKIAHSSASLDGPWSPFSNVLTLVYAHAGSGGGIFPPDPTPPDRTPSGFAEL